MSKNLQLPLIKKWFDLTKSLEKKEDYREINPYWCNRLLLYDGKSQSMDFWRVNIVDFYLDYHIKFLFEHSDVYKLTPKQFKNNVMTLGYPKFDDKERYLHLEHTGIEIRTGRKEWGADPNKLYFVIKHGSIIN